MSCPFADPKGSGGSWERNWRAPKPRTHQAADAAEPARGSRGIIHQCMNHGRLATPRAGGLPELSGLDQELCVLRRRFDRLGGARYDCLPCAVLCRLLLSLSAQVWRRFVGWCCARRALRRSPTPHPAPRRVTLARLQKSLRTSLQRSLQKGLQASLQRSRATAAKMAQVPAQAAANDTWSRRLSQSQPKLKRSLKPRQRRKRSLTSKGRLRANLPRRSQKARKRAPRTWQRAGPSLTDQSTATLRLGSMTLKSGRWSTQTVCCFLAPWWARPQAGAGGCRRRPRLAPGAAGCLLRLGSAHKSQTTNRSAPRG